MPDARDIEDWTPDKLRTTAAELRNLVHTTTKQSAVTKTLLALAATYDALADEDDDVNRQLIQALLVTLLGEYARMGRLLRDALACLSEQEFAQFLIDHSIESDLAVHAMQLAEGQIASQ